MIKLENTRKPIETESTVNGCVIIVNRAVDKDGYVVVSHEKKRKFAHRLSYEQNIGQIPKGMVVRHKCDNPKCINPKHLELGTHSDNVQDRVDRSRSAIGVNNGRSKLTEEDVRKIRNDNKSTISSLAKEFNVSRKNIRNIKNRVTWRFLK